MIHIKVSKATPSKVGCLLVRAGSQELPSQSAGTAILRGGKPQSPATGSSSGNRLRRLVDPNLPAPQMRRRLPHPGPDRQRPQPVGERRDLTQVFEYVPLGNRPRGDLPAFANLKRRSEDPLGEIDPERVVQHGAMPDISEMLLGRVQEIVQRQVVLEPAAEASQAALRVMIGMGNRTPPVSGSGWFC